MFHRHLQRLIWLHPFPPSTQLCALFVLGQHKRPAFELKVAPALQNVIKQAVSRSPAALQPPELCNAALSAGRARRFASSALDRLACLLGRNAARLLLFSLPLLSKTLLDKPLSNPPSTPLRRYKHCRGGGTPCR